eukprot:2579522-Alexandrium_andersonii.AAC.1
MRAAASDEAPAVVSPAPAAGALPDSDDDVLEPLPAGGPCRKEDRRWDVQEEEEHSAEASAAASSAVAPESSA